MGQVEFVSAFSDLIFGLAKLVQLLNGALIKAFLCHKLLILLHHSSQVGSSILTYCSCWLRLLKLVSWLDRMGASGHRWYSHCLLHVIRCRNVVVMSGVNAASANRLLHNLLSRNWSRSLVHELRSLDFLRPVLCCLCIPWRELSHTLHDVLYRH